MLRAANLFGYIDGSTVVPPMTVTEGSGDAAQVLANPDYLLWYQQDQTVMIALLASMSEDILGQMTRLTSARQVWEALHDMFGSKNRARVMQVPYQLSNLKKKGLGAAEYFDKMKGFADTMASIGHPLSDEEILGYMLAGLGPVYEPLVATITARDDPVSLNAFYAHLLSAELRLEQHIATGELYSANAISRNYDGGNLGGGRGGQQHHGGQGGRSRGRGRGRGTSKSGGPKPTCQVCNKYGHDALRCRNRFNHAFQPEENHEHAANTVNTSSGTYTVDTTWYTDSGATDHLTSDLDRLTLHERYAGKGHVQVANGAGLHITHIGQSKVPGSSKSLVLNNVLRVPNIHKNLISVHKLVSDNDAFIEYHPDSFFIKDRATQEVLLRGNCQGGLYPVPSNVDFLSKSSRHGLAGGKLSMDHWHHRLGHPLISVVESVLQSNKIACARPHEPSVCDACQRAKIHQLPYTRSLHTTNSPLELVHSDVWRPALTSIGGFQYYVSFLDDYSRFGWIISLSVSLMLSLLSIVFRLMLSDNSKLIFVFFNLTGGEYRRLNHYFRRTGIHIV